MSRTPFFEANCRTLAASAETSGLAIVLGNYGQLGRDAWMTQLLENRQKTDTVGRIRLGSPQMRRLPGQFGANIRYQLLERSRCLAATEGAQNVHEFPQDLAWSD